MTFEDMNDAINEAEVTIARGNWMVSRMIAMCAGRLRKAGIPASRLSDAKTIRVECPKHGLQELNAIVFAGVALDCGCVWIHTTGGWVLEESEKGAKSQ